MKVGGVAQKVIQIHYPNPRPPLCSFFKFIFVLRFLCVFFGQRVLCYMMYTSTVMRNPL